MQTRFFTWSGNVTTYKHSNDLDNGTKMLGRVIRGQAWCIWDFSFSFVLCFLGGKSWNEEKVISV
jgi:hypothetical protein